MGRHEARDLALVVATVLIQGFLAVRGIQVPVLTPVLATLVVLVLPGYALVAALGDSAPRDFALRAMLVLGTSIAVAALGGLALNLLPFGYNATSWTLVLGVVTLTTCAVAYVRRGPRRSGGREAFTERARLPVRALAVVTLAGAVLVGAVVLSTVSARRQQQNEQVVALSLRPTGSGGLQRLELEIDNHTGASASYRLVIDVSGKPTHTWSMIAVPAQTSWRTTFAMPVASGAHTIPVQAILYQASSPTVSYRDVIVWV